ncbi:MAG TPA: hypothetical protein VEL31_26595 [Ktedonobacteraceae bacterium]|nr:hypothetical protein [Ktedonobacteraceae bacterium]
MDSKRAEVLMNYCRREQHKAYLKWNNLSSRTPELIHEQARLEVSAWARAGDELYTILEQHEQRKETRTNGNEKNPEG